MNNKELILISGPAGSGKSRFAEHLVSKNQNITYIATGENNYSDEDWLARINRHKLRRPNTWQLIEEPRDLSQAIISTKGKNSILIDSLGSYVANNLDMTNDDWVIESQKLITTISKYLYPLIIVIEELGWSVVPSTRSGNIFRERVCSLSTELEILAKESWLVIRGRAINLREISSPIPK